MATGAVVVVTGLNCKGRAEGLANIWKEGNEMSFKSIIIAALEVGGGAARHHSKSKSLMLAYKLIPSCEMGCCRALFQPITLASSMASKVNQQKTASPCAC